MTELLTAAQMRAIETAAMNAGDVTGLELMERAGTGVVDAVLETWPDLSRGAHSAVVLCGPGNNGGDGFVVARLLTERGWDVEVFLYGDPAKLPPDARTNYDRWCRLGDVRALRAVDVGQGAQPVVLVDAMFGTGLTRAIPLECALAHHAVRKREAGSRRTLRVVAVDCPSGLDCDSGETLMPERPDGLQGDTEAHWRWWTDEASRRLLNTDLVLSFHRGKVGHYLGAHGFDLKVVDIGLGAEDRHASHLLAPRDPEVACLLEFDLSDRAARQIWPSQIVAKRPHSGNNKYDFGHALVLTGGMGRTGAARLAARGALRIGAGLVTLGVPPAAQMEVACHITALMMTRVAGADALTAMLEDDRINAVCLGPGLGLDDHAASLVEAMLRSGQISAERRVVFDADALTLLARNPEWMALLSEHAVLTPHGGEFQRLFPDIAEKLTEFPTRGPAFSKVDAARAAAARSGAVILFKGADTVIAHPDGRCSVHAAVRGRAAPWLATAGAGDVLAGFITGLLARAADPMAAAEVAAWLHVECARAFGPGLVAEDLAETLPKVLASVGA